MLELKKYFYVFCSSWLWKKSNKQEPKTVQLARHILQVLYALIADLKDGQLSLRAMSLVYTTVISLVPLFAISFSVLKGLGAHNQIKPFLLSTLEPLGDKSQEITEKIIGFVDNIQVGVLGTLGIAVLLYTVISMMQKIERAFNYVWHVSRERNFGQRFSDYLSALLIGPLLIFLSAGLTTSARSHYIIERLGNFPGVEELITLVGIIIPYLMLSAAFTFLYCFVPNTKVSLKAALISGLITAFLWKLMGLGVSNFVANSGSHTAIYSAFAIIIVFMIWIYLAWLVLLVGASIGFYWQYPEYRKIRHTSPNIAPEYKEAVAVQVMTEIAQRFQKHDAPATTNELAELCGEPQKIITEIAGYLEQAGLLTEQCKPHAWLPARPPEHISIYDIIVAVRKHKGNTMPSFGKVASQYTKDLDNVLKKQFAKQTLGKP